MQILDKIIMDNIEFTCIQELCINGKIVYVIYNSDNESRKIIEEINKEYKVIEDEEILDKVYELNNPKTDVIADE